MCVTDPLCLWSTIYQWEMNPPTIYVGYDDPCWTAYPVPEDSKYIDLYFYVHDLWGPEEKSSGGASGLPGGVPSVPDGVPSVPGGLPGGLPGGARSCYADAMPVGPVPAAAHASLTRVCCVHADSFSESRRWSRYNTGLYCTVQIEARACLHSVVQQPSPAEPLLTIPIVLCFARSRGRSRSRVRTW